MSLICTNCKYQTQPGAKVCPRCRLPLQATGAMPAPPVSTAAPQIILQTTSEPVQTAVPIVRPRFAFKSDDDMPAPKVWVQVVAVITILIPILGGGYVAVFGLPKFGGAKAKVPTEVSPKTFKLGHMSPQEEFSRIQLGMTREEVTKILGDPFTTNMDGLDENARRLGIVPLTKGQTYIYSGPTQSIYVTYVNNKVAQIQSTEPE